MDRKKKKRNEKYHTICRALEENEDNGESDNDEWDEDSDSWNESEQIEECIAEYSEGMEDLMDAIAP